jgi:hypothetical protein
VEGLTLVGRPASNEEIHAQHEKLDAGLLTRIYKSAREETTSVTEEIGKVESEIDERVKSLYGV